MGPAWLSERMFRIFMELFDEGRVHAQEVVCEGNLVGGFFGVCVGDLCFGEYTAGTAPGGYNCRCSASGKGNSVDRHAKRNSPGRFPGVQGGFQALICGLLQTGRRGR